MFDVWVVPGRGIGDVPARDDAEVAKFCKHCFQELSTCEYCGDKVVYDSFSHGKACYNPETDCLVGLLNSRSDDNAIAMWNMVERSEASNTEGEMAECCADCGETLEADAAVRFHGDGQDYCAGCIVAFFKDA